MGSPPSGHVYHLRLPPPAPLLPYTISQVRPYANLLGILALPPDADAAACLEAVRRAAAVHPPEYT